MLAAPSPASTSSCKSFGHASVWGPRQFYDESSSTLLPTTPARTAALNQYSRIPEAPNPSRPLLQPITTHHNTHKTACYVGFARPGKPPLIHAAHDVHAAKSDIRRVKPRVAVRCMREGCDDSSSPEEDTCTAIWSLIIALIWAGESQLASRDRCPSCRPLVSRLLLWLEPHPNRNATAIF